MKNWIPLGLFLLSGCALWGPLPTFQAPALKETASSHSPQVDLKKLDLPRAIQIATRANPDYQMVHQRIQKAGGLYLQTDSQFYPRLQFQARYFHADSPLSFFGTKLDQRKFVFGGNLNNPGDFGSGRLGLQVQYGLNLGGAQFFRHYMARLELEIARKERDKALNVLVSSLMETFYNCLAAKSYIQIVQDSVKTVAVQLKETQVKFKGGSALKSDVLSLQVRLATAKEEVILAKNRFELIKSTLAILMGLDPAVSLDLQENPWETGPLPKSYEKALSVALKNRPEIQIAQKRVLQADYNKRLALTGYMPDWKVFGTYYLEDREFGYSMQRDNWQVGTALNWTLFDGAQTYGKYKAARAEKREALYGYKKTLLQIKFQVKKAYQDWEEAGKRVQVLSLAVKQAQENLSLVKKQFEGGASTITKYLNAELDWKTARFRLSSAQYDLKKSRAAMGHALGLSGGWALAKAEK